jgi:tryptophanyl-tRNA synthetase
MKKRIFSGAQPTGTLNIGNYLGALKYWVALQYGYDPIYCIVNLHGLTLPQDPKTYREKTLDLARIYLAAGVDPAHSTVFIQSDVAEHAELTWILSCISRMGELERMTQFKDKGKGNERAGVGLFTYPVLMAADILLYQTDLVPFGQDQKQHLELTRDIAERFNRDFGETFVVPDAYIPPVGAKIMSLQDPSKKMSKSDEDLNASIFLLDDQDVIAKKIKRAVTDSGTDIVFDPERPAITNLLTIYQLLTGKSADECVEHFRGKGYGHFKTELADVLIDFLAPFQKRMNEYDDATLSAVLKTGAEKARDIAAATLESVYTRTGLR